jgi:hypothetical protein
MMMIMMMMMLMIMMMMVMMCVFVCVCVCVFVCVLFLVFEQYLHYEIDDTSPKDPHLAYSGMQSEEGGESPGGTSPGGGVAVVVVGECPHTLHYT